MSSQAFRPAAPVAQLALPEFTRTARTRPRLDRKDARPTSRGAATTRFLVKSAAAVAPAVASASAKSGRPLTLIPAAMAEKAKPRGTIIFSGDRRNALMLVSSTSWKAAAELRIWAPRRAPWPLHRSYKIVDICDSPCGSYPADPDAPRW